MEENKNKGLIWLIIILVILFVGLVSLVVYKTLEKNKGNHSDDSITTTTITNAESNNKKNIIDLTKKEKLQNLFENLHELEDIFNNEESIQYLEKNWNIKLEIINGTLNYSYNNGEIYQTINNVKKVMYNVLDGSAMSFMFAVITEENDVWFINEGSGFSEDGYWALFRYNELTKETIQVKPKLKKMKNKYSDIKVSSLYGGDCSYYIGVINGEYYDLRNEEKLNDKLSVFLYDDCYLTTDGEIISKNKNLNIKYKYGIYECTMDCEQEYIITDNNYLYQTPDYDYETEKYGDFKIVYNKKISKVEKENEIIKIYFEDNTLQEFENLFIMNDN